MKKTGVPDFTMGQQRVKLSCSSGHQVRCDSVTLLFSSRDQAEKSSSDLLTGKCPGDTPAEGRIIETNAQALRSRPRPRIQIV